MHTTVQGTIKVVYIYRGYHKNKSDTLLRQCTLYIDTVYIVDYKQTVVLHLL